MARDISELGADVYDDTPVDPKHKMSKKKRNYIIGLSILAAFIAGSAAGIVILCNTSLTDYSNVENVKYYFTPKNDPNGDGNSDAVLYRLLSDKKYPSTFRIPSQIKGHKVVGVASEAFAGHEEIEKVIMPNTIQFVGDKAFSNCVNLKTFSWSKNLDTVGLDAFDNTAFFNAIIEDTHSLYDLPSGLLIYVGQDYFKEKTALVSSELTEQEINDIKTTYGVEEIFEFKELKVKNISSGAFKKNDKIVYLDFPKEMTHVSISTFENCPSLKALSFEHSSVKEIGDRAFAACENLETITLADTVEKIGDEVFSETGLTNGIPNLSSVKTLGEGIFSYCFSLESAVFEGTYVPNYTFNACDSLVDFSFGESKDKITKLGMGAFTETKIEEFEVPINVTELKQEVFKDCAKLKKVTMYGNPNDVMITIGGEESQSEVLKGVNSIEASAFENCKKLTTISLYDDDYNLIADEEGTFNLPKSLLKTDVYTKITGTNNKTFASTAAKKVVISPNTKTIGSYAFQGVSTLEEVVFTDMNHSELKTIDSNAFSGCKKLKQFSIPKMVTKLGSGAFRNCSALESIQFNDSGDENVFIQAINANTFNGCTSLKSIDLPDTITIIKSNAFYRNYELNYLIVPEAVIEIQDDAFGELRENEGETMPVYICHTYAETNPVDEQGKPTRGVINYNKDTCIDETGVLFYLLGEGEERQAGVHYWNGDKANPQEI